MDSGATATYTYDGDGRRAVKSFSGTTTYYFYDPTGRLLTETTGLPGTGKDYLYLQGAPIGRVDWSVSELDLGNVLRVNKNSPNVHLDWALYPPASNTYVVRRKQVVNPNDKTFNGSAIIATLNDPVQAYDDAVLNDGNRYDYRVLRQVMNDALYFYHTDHLGTPIAMTDGSASFVWRAEHLPFGGLWSLPVSTVANNLRLPGQYLDGETGLHQNWWRYYRPNTGRYDEPDPLGLVTDDLHLYTYASDNPIHFTDPFGLTSYIGFSPGDEQNLRSAVDIVRQKLHDQPCCVNGAADTLLHLLDKATFLYRADLRYKGDLVCGLVGPIDWLKRRIKLGAIAFEPAKCGPLECTVLHETVHLRVRRAGEGPAYAAEKSCFNCGTGVPPE